MDNSQPSKSYLAFIKLTHFLVAMIFAEQVIGTGFANFIESLNNKGILKLGEKFQFGLLIWGENIGPNILHIFILIFLASVFGYVFGYLQPKLNKFEKILFTISYAFFRFFSLSLIQLFIGVFMSNQPSSFDKILMYQYYLISFSPLNTTFFLIGQLAIFYFSIYFMNIGISNSNENVARAKGTLFGIKWYHYLWLYIPIMTYFHLFLYLTYRFFNGLTEIAKKFKILDFLFRGDYYHINKEGANSVTLIFTFIFLLILYVVLIFVMWNLMKYLRLIVTGKTPQSLGVKILISILIGIAAPILIQYYYLV